MSNAFIPMAYMTLLRGDSLDNCDSQTKQYFQTCLDSLSVIHYNTDDIKANYEANKAIATQEFDSYLSSWSNGDFYSSGMH